MALQPYDPWERLLTIRRQMLDLFGELMTAPSSLPASVHGTMRELEELVTLRSAHPAFVPPVDMAQVRGCLIVRVALPGVTEDSLEIAVESSALVVRGVSEEPYPSVARVMMRECPCGAFERRIALPEGVSSRQLSARLEDGVLEITVPIEGA